MAGNHEIKSFNAPPVEKMGRMLSLAKAYFNPTFLGLENLTFDRPALFVGNHTLFGLTDAPLMIERIYREHGTLLRGLGDRGHFNVPFWGEFLVSNGMVLGTPENCSALMNSGESILVFPGGGREVMRRKGESHSLVWKKRAGFARMAIQHGYDIIPFGSVGPDDNYKILVDANDVTASKPWKWLDQTLNVNKLTRNGDMIPPIVRGLGPTLIPRPQQFYFGFGERIETQHLSGQETSADAVWNVREQTRTAVEGQIKTLLTHRKADRSKNWGVARKFLAPIGG
ncbi:MAG: lysophospholipid acyltransferase family protein [Gammaproteobacteria bacterium]|nr:lysophospholipid acyltransferase family protein [Gammaproteobacteria bacterium]